MKPSGNDTKYDASPSSSIERSKMSKISHLRLKMMKKPPSKTKVKTEKAVRNYFVPFLVVVTFVSMCWAWMYLFQSRLFAAQALTALEHGQSAASLEMFRKSISCNPHNAAAHFYCGLICERNGALASALDYFTESARLAPGNPDVLDRQASIALKLERYRLAAQAYKQLFMVKSFVPAAQQIRNQALALEKLGKSNEALVGYVVSLRLDKKNPAAIEGVARCQMAQGEYDKAVETLNKLLSADKNNVSALLLRGWSYKNLGFKGMAHSDLDAAISLAPRRAETHLYKARFLNVAGGETEALKELDKAVVAEPKNTVVRKERAELLIKLERYEEALADFAKLPPGESNLYTRVSRARKAVTLGTPNALKLLDEIIASYPRFSSLYVERATCLARHNNCEAAIADCNKALSIRPSSVTALLKRAQINATAGNTAGAVEDFESVAARNPSNFAAFVGLGNAQLKLARYGSALRSFRKASQLRPRSCEAAIGVRTASNLLLAIARSNRENKFAEEISETELVDIEQANFSSLIEKSYAALKSHRLPFAIKALRRAVQLDANSVLARRYLATALLANKRPQDAEEQFIALERLGERRSTGDELKLADCYLENGSPKRAAELLTNYLAKNSRDINAVVLLSRAYASCGNTDLALEVCSKAMANAKPSDYATLQKVYSSLKNTTANDPDAYEKEANDVSAMDLRS